MKIGPVIAVLSAGVTTAVLAAQVGLAQDSGTRTLTLIQGKTHPTFVDLGRRSRGPFSPTAGDLMIFSAPLSDQAGARLGRSQGYCIVVDVAHRGEECSYTMGLRDGQVTGTGKTVFAKRFDVPVTGGTGAYEGARGIMHFTIGRERDVVEIRLLS